MRIAYIATSRIPSSTANSIQVMKVCQALTQNGEEVHLYIPGRGNLDWNAISKQYGLALRFPITLLPSRHPLKRLDFVWAALQHARINRADLIYTRLLWAAAGALFIKKPVILEMHDLPAGRFGPRLFKWYLESTGTKLTVVITNSLRSRLEEKFKFTFSEQEVLVAPDGVDIERYAALPDAPAARKKLGLKEAFTAAYSGGFYEGRGLETLLELAGAFPQIQFLWIGGRPEEVARWTARIEELHLANVVLTGFVSNSILPSYQAAADILLMPYGKAFSGSSGGNIADVSSPMKMFEYMAAGRAILTSDIPVLREVLNENNACFYKPEDFSDLRDQFSVLLSDDQKRAALASQAKIDVTNYTWQKRMQRIIKFIGEVQP